jgi:hypothetical protein
MDVYTKFEGRLIPTVTPGLREGEKQPLLRDMVE